MFVSASFNLKTVRLCDATLGKVINWPSDDPLAAVHCARHSCSAAEGNLSCHESKKHREKSGLGVLRVGLDRRLRFASRLSPSIGFVARSTTDFPSDLQLWYDNQMSDPRVSTCSSPDRLLSMLNLRCSACWLRQLRADPNDNVCSFKSRCELCSTACGSSVSRVCKPNSEHQAVVAARVPCLASPIACLGFWKSVY
jgi:hypothetical protein